MKKLIGLLIVILLTGGFLLAVFKNESEVKYPVIAKQFGSVEVSLEPKEPLIGKEMVFEMAINTHSGDLGYDWTEIAKIKDNGGNEYKVVSWTGETGGHHLNGELVFEPLKIGAKEIVLTIMDVDGISESFVWKIK